MIIRLSGCKDKHLRREILRAAKFYSHELMSNKLLPYVIVDIHIREGLRDYGNCVVTYFNDWYKPREFEIEIRGGMSEKMTLSTLAHEFVHVKQFAKGQLNDQNNKWMGKRIDSDEIPYHLLPWEIEASLQERILYHLYVDQRDG